MQYEPVSAASNGTPAARVDDDAQLPALPAGDFAGAFVSSTVVYSRDEMLAFRAEGIAHALGTGKAEADGLTREQWTSAAERVYLACGDDEATAKRCAAWIAGEQDWLSCEVGDPYEEALEDIEGRSEDTQQPHEDTERLDWLERRCCDVSRLGDSARTIRIAWNNGADHVDVGPHTHRSWREAIDAARHHSSTGGEEA